MEMEIDFKSGIVADPRTNTEKIKDFRHEEIASTVALNWKEKAYDEWRKFPKRDQDGSSSCMAHSGVKILGVENFIEEKKFIELSATPIYQARQNKPNEGMWQQDCLDLLSKPIACKESSLPSQGIGEALINEPFTLSEEMEKEAELYRSNGYAFVSAKDIDSIASVIEQGKAVQLMLFFLGNEYWKGTPEIIDSTLKQREERSLRHGVSAVDYCLINGKKALIIEDSAGWWTTINQTGQRIITEDFLISRCFGAGYLIYRKNAEKQTLKPKVKFTTSLSFGIMKNNNVALLQDILKYEGFFPINFPSTGNFLQITAKAVVKWQIKHGIMDFATEPDIRKVRFGPRSILIANLMYNN